MSYFPLILGILNKRTSRNSIPHGGITNKIADSLMAYAHLRPLYPRLPLYFGVS